MKPTSSLVTKLSMKVVGGFHMDVNPNHIYMKVFRYLTLVTAMLFIASACTDDFDKINTNPNGPTSISPQFLLPSLSKGYRLNK